MINNGIDAEAEFSRLLQEELDKIWEETPIGYNELNNGFHLGKGLIVNEETWNQYTEALKTRPELNPYNFVVELLKKIK